MTTSFLNAETLRRSLYAQFKCVFWLITIFVVLAAGPAIVLTEQSTGSGGAINVSGSLRMMSYKLTVAVSNPYATYQECDKATRDAVKEFGTRLESPSLTLDAKNHIRELYELVHKRFSDEVSSLAFESIDSEAARRAFLLKVPGFVDDVDRFVFALEESLSWRLTLLKVCLLITLAGAIALTFIMLSVMRRKVFAPLEELEATAERVRQKNFTARSKSADSSNEIGRFAKSFNFMVSELERLYGSLESEVARTTADLHRRNRGLEFLARASEDLMVDGPSLAGAVSEVLKGAVELAEARSAVFYVAKNRE
jgi:nitrate/nitrite sensor protein